MADIKVLEEKVQKATEKVEKCKKTITRHEGILAKKIKAGDEYGVRYKEDEIKGAKSKLNVAEEILENWKAKLDAEIEKERFLEGNAPQVIKDFLERWKKLAYDWHIRRYDEYFKLSDRLKAEAKEVKVNFIKTYMQPEIEHYMNKYNDTEEEAIESVYRWNDRAKNHLKEKKLDSDSIYDRKNNFAGLTVLKMVSYRKEEERLQWLDKTLEAEKKAKMLDLINRINAVVGTITDAQYLLVSPEGNLNGIITGEKGKAKIETIGAGGYNIQCFHYRTLIHKL